MSCRQKVTSNEQKVTSSEQKTTSKKQKVTSNEHKVTSNEQKITSNEQKVTSNEHKVTDNDRKVQPHLNIRNSETLTSFKGNIFKFIRPSENSFYLCNNLKVIQLIIRLRLGLLSHLNINLSIPCKTFLIQFVTAVRILKLRVTTFVTVTLHH